MKDAQQVAVVDGLINDFFMDIKLVPVDTVREEDGLAKARGMCIFQKASARKRPLSISRFSTAPG